MDLNTTSCLWHRYWPDFDYSIWKSLRPQCNVKMNVGLCTVIILTLAMIIPEQFLTTLLRLKSPPLVSPQRKVGSVSWMSGWLAGKIKRGIFFFFLLKIRKEIGWSAAGEGELIHWCDISHYGNTSRTRDWSRSDARITPVTCLETWTEADCVHYPHLFVYFKG